MQLLVEVVHHMMTLVKQVLDPSTKVVGEIKDEKQALDVNEHPNPRLIIWMLSLFAQFTKDNYQDAQVAGSSYQNAVRFLGDTVFPKATVSLLVQLVCQFKGDFNVRLAMTRLLAYIIRSISQVSNAVPPTPAAAAEEKSGPVVPVQDSKRTLLFKNEIFALFDLMDKVYKPKPGGFLRCLLETNIIVLQELEKASQKPELPKGAEWFGGFLETFRLVTALQPPERGLKEVKREDTVDLPPKFLESVLSAIRRWADEKSSIPDGLAVVVMMGENAMEGVLTRLRADGIAEVKLPFGSLFAPADSVKSKEGKSLDYYELQEMNKLMAPFRRGSADEDLVKLIRDVCDKNQRDSIDARSLTPTDDQLTHYPTLEKLTVRQLRVRAELLNHFNGLITPYLEFLDLKLPAGASLLTDGLRAVRGLIFWSNKKAMYQQAIDSSAVSSSSQASIEINNYKAIGLRMEGKTDWKAKRSTFAQAFRQLRELKDDQWKRKKNERLYTVRLVGEHAADAGGPYRQSIATFCE